VRKIAKNRMHIDIRVAGKPPWDIAKRDHRIRAVTFCEAVGSGGGEVWDGSHWNAQVIPSPASASLARGVVRVTDILRGSRRRPVRSGVERYCVERAVRFESPTATFTHLNGVSCAAAASCKAVGYFEVAATANNPKALGRGLERPFLGASACGRAFRRYL